MIRKWLRKRNEVHGNKFTILVKGINTGYQTEKDNEKIPSETFITRKITAAKMGNEAVQLIKHFLGQ